MALDIAEASRPREGRSNEVKGQAPVDRRASVGGPRSTLETIVSETALMWILHQHARSSRERNEPLAQQISEFSTTVFKTILQDSPKTKHEHLWMIYFKGLIVSNTHPREDMVQAIHHVQAQNVARWKASVGSSAPSAKEDHGSPEASASPEATEHADSDVLRQINTALGNAPANASS